MFSVRLWSVHHAASLRKLYEFFFKLAPFCTPVAKMVPDGRIVSDVDFENTLHSADSGIGQLGQKISGVLTRADAVYTARPVENPYKAVTQRQV